MGVIGRTLRFTLGLGLGMGIGAVATMLLAPQSGRPYKEQIQQRFNDIVNSGKQASKEREKELQEYWEQEISADQNAEGEKKS